MAEGKVHLVVVPVAAVLQRRPVPKLLGKPIPFSGVMKAEAGRAVANNAVVAAKPMAPAERRFTVAAVSGLKSKTADLL